ncbi:MAG: anti-sigma regulatory factor [Jaaginema sp. PMC 1078.18]|nr:anti-sigma regulatory factor [Jaaginema sp. PMC 1078.18]
MSFASTIYLCPILDLLLTHVPSDLEPELRLGLQEALVNAAVHGNRLDPSKTVMVQFSVTENLYSWVISDQGKGFSPQCQCQAKSAPEDLLPADESEDGRGLCLLYHIFDRVHWNEEGNQLHLCKYIKALKPSRSLALF